MTNEVKIRQLQKIIEEGIGDRTRRAFALEVGITPEHLSRLMKKGYKVIPNTRILAALAGSLPNTTKEELFDIFEVNPINSDKYESDLASFSSIICHNIKQTVDVILNNNRLYENTKEFFNRLSLMNQYGKLSAERINDIVKDGETIELWKLTCFVNENIFSFYLGVKTRIVSKYQYDADVNWVTGDTELFIIDVIYNGEELEELGFQIDATTRIPYTTKVSEENPTTESFDEERASIVIYGFGFYLNEGMKEQLESFIQRYPIDLVLPDNMSTEEKVAHIIATRTRLNFEYLSNSNKKAILIQKDPDILLESTIKTYAKELGIKEYGRIHIIKEVTIKQDELYQIND